MLRPARGTASRFSRWRSRSSRRMVEAPPALEARSLSKQFGAKVAVRELSLTLPRGEVFGFLGPNGAGKTTSMKMLLGLVRPTSGEGRLLGEPLGAARGRARVGYLPEHFAFHEWLEGRELLRFHARLLGMPTRGLDAGVEERLRRVNLADAATRRVREYSKGMKQRLGIAAALVHDPGLLILDEPTIGLDPAGMLEMRQLLRRLAKEEGKTILLSSHLLHEVEQVCDRVLILQKGRTIASGRVDELLEQGGYIEVRIDREAEALSVLRNLDWVAGAQLRDGVIYVDAPPERAAELTAALSNQGLYLRGLQVTERSLESYFLDVTGSDGQDGDDG